MKDRALLLTCENINRLDKQKESALVFIGGFDSPEIAKDFSKDMTFLALSYPASNYEELKRNIGSIDYK